MERPLPFAFAPMPLAPVLPVPRLSAIAAEEFLVSFVIVVAAVSSSGVYARMTPPGLLGRVTAARRTVSIGVIPLGSLIAGAIAPVLGYDLTIWAGTALMTASVGVFAASPLFRCRNLPPEWEHHDTTIASQPG